MLRREVQPDKSYARRRQEILQAKSFSDLEHGSEYTLKYMTQLKFLMDDVKCMPVSTLPELFARNAKWWRTPHALSSSNEISSYDLDDIVAENPVFRTTMQRINNRIAAT